MFGIAVAGCAAPVDVADSLAPDGTVHRTIRQPVRTTTRRYDLEIPAPDRTGWSTWSRRGDTVRASGSFAPDAEVPPHWRAGVHGAGLESRNRVSRAAEDWGLFVRHRWEEGIGNSVSREEFRAARGEMLALGMPLFEEWLDRMYGDRFELADLKGWVRDRVVPVFETMTERAYDYGREQPAGEPNPRELLRRMGQPLEGLGVPGEARVPVGGAGKELAKLWLARTLQTLLRHRVSSSVDGPTAGGPAGAHAPAPDATVVPPRPDAAAPDAVKRGVPLSFAEALALVQEADSPDGRARSKLYSDAIAVEKFGSREAAEQRFRGLGARMAGVYGGPLTILPRLRFEFRLRMPGEVVSTNGTRRSAGEVAWVFFEHALFPAGLTMRAESVELRPDVQRRVFGGRVPVADAATAAEVLAVIEGRPTRAGGGAVGSSAEAKSVDLKQAAAIRRALLKCVEAGTPDALRELAASESKAKGDDAPAARLAALLGVGR